MPARSMTSLIGVSVYACVCACVRAYVHAFVRAYVCVLLQGDAKYVIEASEMETA